MKSTNSLPVWHKYFFSENHTACTNPYGSNDAFDCWLIDNIKSNWPKSFFVRYWKHFLILWQIYQCRKERNLFFLHGSDIRFMYYGRSGFPHEETHKPYISLLLTINNKFFTILWLSPGSFTVLQITVHYQEIDFYKKPSPRTLTVRILLIFLQLQHVKFSNRTALPIHCVVTYPEREACPESHSAKTFTGEQEKFYNALTIIRLIAFNGS